MLFAVFDTETTGLPYHPRAPLSQQPRVIEFGGIITDGESILETLEFICDPGVQIEQIITDITGLTNDDLAGKPPFKEFVLRLGDYFGHARGRVAHNLSFDRSMLEFDLARIGQTLDAIYWDSTDLPAVEICTVEQTQAIYGKPMKLVTLYNELIEPYEQKHRALDDVIRLHKIAKAIGVYEALKEAA